VRAPKLARSAYADCVLWESMADAPMPVGGGISGEEIGGYGEFEEQNQTVGEAGGETRSKETVHGRRKHH